MLLLLCLRTPLRDPPGTPHNRHRRNAKTRAVATVSNLYKIGVMGGASELGTAQHAYRNPVDTLTHCGGGNYWPEPTPRVLAPKCLTLEINNGRPFEREWCHPPVVAYTVLLVLAVSGWLRRVSWRVPHVASGLLSLWGCVSDRNTPLHAQDHCHTDNASLTRHTSYPKPGRRYC